MRKLASLTAAAAMVAVFGFAGTAWADITIEKEIVAIDVNDNDTDVITDPGEITAFLADVPNSTVISFTVEITVGATAGQDLTGIVVTDRFGTELDVSCVDNEVGACDDPNGPDVSLFGPGNTKMRWDVGDLDDGETATLTLEAVTNTDNDGNQRYTSCGPHEFNSGATAKGRLDRGTNPAGKVLGTKQVSADTDSIMLFVSGFVVDGEGVDFPECSNCFDDDDDNLTDFPADPGCTDETDNSELPVN